MSITVVTQVRVTMTITRGDVTTDEEFNIHPHGDDASVYLATRTTAPFDRAYFYPSDVAKPLFDALALASARERMARDKQRYDANPPTLHPAQWRRVKKMVASPKTFMDGIATGRIAITPKKPAKKKPK